MNKQMTFRESLLFQKQYVTLESHPAQDTTPIMSESSEPNETQIGGRHYQKCSIQPWDYVIANDLDYFQGSIIKYVTRWRDKGWIQDLHKAKHFLDKYIETMEEKYKGMKERPEPTQDNQLKWPR